MEAARAGLARSLQAEEPVRCGNTSEALVGSWHHANGSWANQKLRHDQTVAVQAAGCQLAGQWSWVPRGCSLGRKDFHGYCGRQVAFVGDSISLQSFSALLLMLRSLPLELPFKCTCCHKPNATVTIARLTCVAPHLCRCTTEFPKPWAQVANCTCRLSRFHNKTCNVSLAFISNRFLCAGGTCGRPEYVEATSSADLDLSEFARIQKSAIGFSFANADFVFQSGLHWTSNHQGIASLGPHRVEETFRANVRTSLAIATQLQAASIHFRTMVS